MAEEYMTYSADFRAQVIKSVKQSDMSIRQACTFYNISKTALQRWLKDSSIKQTRDKPPTKILNEALLKVTPAVKSVQLNLGDLNQAA